LPYSSWCHLVIAGIVLTGSVGLVRGAWAQSSSDVYTVTGVSVDATGPDAAQARAIALAQARLKAADQGARRLTLDADWPQLPPFDEASAERLVIGIGVENERASGTRYLADVTVRLDPVGMRALLQQAGVRYTDTQAAPSLLLPVADVDGGRVLFEDPNPWRAAWEGVDTSNALVPLVLPLGDLQDLAAIDAATALNADWPSVAAIAARYRVQQVTVAHARLRDGAHLDVTLYDVTASGTTSTTTSFAAATLEGASAKAAQDTYAALSANWKIQNAATFGLEQTVPASVRFGSLAEWQAIRTRLIATGTVQSVDVVAVSPTGAQVNLRVAGSMPLLVANLGQRQVALTDEGGEWTIMLAGAGDAPAGSAAPPAQPPAQASPQNETARPATP